MASRERAQDRRSVLSREGVSSAIDELIEEIQELYLADEKPWIVGYSGGKDSTAVAQLIWSALAGLSPEQRSKTVHIISTDTLVENPQVSLWVDQSLRRMRAAAEEAELPITVNLLTPKITDTFWVNLIGRGYPAPRHKFRWCTERLKIAPSNTFITELGHKYGSAILAVGTRAKESTQRAGRMRQYAEAREKGARYEAIAAEREGKLEPNPQLPNTTVYSPLRWWANDDVWFYLLNNPNPWGHDNHDLLGMYSGANEDGECPLVVETGTPSCGDSRFGCFVCTLVEKDKSMTGMIKNDREKEWMLPLLKIREEIDFRNKGDDADRHLRDFRRMSGSVQLFKGRLIHGPYTKENRERWLRLVLEAEHHIHSDEVEAPDAVHNLQLIRVEELEEIRRIWVVDKHEIEDTLPGIYEDVLGEPYPGRRLDEDMPFAAEELAILREVCDGDDLHYEMCRNAIDLERQYQSKARRRGLLKDLESNIRSCFYTDADDALAYARARQDHREAGKTEWREERETQGDFFEQIPADDESASP